MNTPYAAKRALKRLLTMPRRIAASRIRRERRDIGRGPRVLLVARDPLMARYGTLIAETLPSDADLVTATTLRETVVAGLHWWDLVIFTDHGTAVLFDAEVHKLFVGHGFGSGKIVEGQAYRHGPQWTLDTAGNCLYDVMLEPSELATSSALAINPALAPCLRVVGDPIVDQLEAMRDDRDRHRSALGIAFGQRAALVISTWGPNGLAATDSMLRLTKVWRARGDAVIVSVHPRAWRQDLADAATALGARVLRPDEDWKAAVVACDDALVDHTAMSLYVAALGTPVAFGPVAAGQLDPRSLEATLRDCASTDAYAALAHALVEHRGQAHTRIQAEVMRLLKP